MFTAAKLFYMKTVKSCILMAYVGVLAISYQSCKPKQVVLQPAAEVIEREAPAERVVAEPKKEEPKAAPTQPAATPATPPNYTFKNIQFEYDSHVLKTESYAILDQIAREMQKDANAKFVIDGHASIEGTAAYNMELSIDRANAVKLYLVNSGINGNNLAVNGFGATKPVASNDTEAGRTRNRRVEIKHID
ncbi:OmpA family protein [Parapedobacter koreensis]|uniref:OmpA-OmpF porin, OOP family n=1 Tax=Parapedobacter koreensis TaxID=332977 RepID=A0A1H7ILA8_9SPHI|nr:OmpA family protein [Parapedobacter koreensis]SEK63259.1 OmpA-OmpF porin, OOP family [Parapedobacter koreensis]